MACGDLMEMKEERYFMKTAVIYWSGSGNTEQMAKGIALGMESAGVSSEVFFVDSFLLEEADVYEAFALGCPSMGAEVLEESTFEPFFEKLEEMLAGKKIALFGSYGWGDGAWMRDWEERVRQAGATLFENGLILQGAPDVAGEARCKAFGAAFAKQL